MAAPDLPAPPDLGAIERPVSVHLHPRFVTPEAMVGGVALVIDNLRASVTIAAALAAGATSVRPMLTVEEALKHRWLVTKAMKSRARRHEFGPTASDPAPLRENAGPIPLLGGERGGQQVPGFDLDNSPLNYTAARCRGRPIVFTTTNGTAALLHARLAGLIVVASLSNVSAVARAAASDPRPIHILCAGTRDEIGLDDCLVAGALVERLLKRGRRLVQDDSGRLCLRAWRDAARTPATLARAMRDTRGGRNLVRLGMGADVAFCARPNLYRVVPVFNPATGLITLLK